MRIDALSTRTLIASLLAVSAIAPAAAQQFDESSTLKASKILPSNLLRGKYHTVDETVRIDGVMNRYVLRIPQGKLDVIGPDRLELWIEETAGLQAMEKTEQSEVFGEALKRSAAAPVKFAGDMITEPGETMEDVGEGVGDFFNSVGHSLFGGGSEEESGAVATVLGYDVIKRKFAFQFGVDPYTTNPMVQERLTELSRAAFLGGVPLKVATTAMPAGAGITIRATGGAYGLSKLIRDKSPAELKEINGGKLKAMGVPQATAERFLSHPHFSPTKKTIITHVLERMEGVENRSAFIELAGLVKDEPLAFFYQEQAEDLAAYHNQVSRFSRLIKLRQFIFGQRADGVVVGMFPVDFLTWTKRSANSSTNLEAELKGMGATRFELWIAGDMTPLYKKNLTELGWTVQVKAREKLRPQ